MSDDEVTSQGDAGNEPEQQLPTPAEETADQVSAGVEGSPSSSPPSQTSGTEESPEGEPGGEPESGETSAAGAQRQPKLTPEEITERLLAIERTRDSDGNAETRPPDGETVTLRSVTVAEVYVGREGDSLSTALGAIEWVDFEEPIAQQITAARKGDEYYSAQFLLASGPVRGLTLRGYGKVSLPAGIERIYGRSYVLGPSIVALCLTFVFTDAEAGRLDAALRKDAQSRVDRTGSSYAPKAVYHVKGERVRLLEDELGNRCLAWLKEKFPGTLAAGGVAVPLCSLVSLARGEPFREHGPYMRLLDLSNAFFAYRFARPDYLFLAPRTGRARERNFIAAFNELNALSPGSYPDLSVTPEILHVEISSFMVMQALEGLFRLFDSRMRDIRSDLEKLDFDHADESQVLGLRNRLLGMSRDVAIVCGDVAVVVDDAVMIWGDYPQLSPVDPSLPTAERTADAMRRRLRALMTHLQTQETGLRELVLITSQAVNDAQNIHLQKKVLSLTSRLNLLTIALVALTGVLVYLAVAQSFTTTGNSDVPATRTRSPVPAAHSSTPATRASTGTPKPSPTG